MKMPWGENRGTEMSKLSDSYLKWLVDRCYDDVIREEAEDLLQERRDQNLSFKR